MRFFYPTLTRPKAAAKIISDHIDGLTLSKVQEGLAVALGYKDWHELTKSHAAGKPTVLDQDLPETEAPVRIADVAVKLADALDLYRGDAGYVLARSRATGDLKLDDWLKHAIGDSLEGTAVVGRDEHDALHGFRFLDMTALMSPEREIPRRREGEPNRLKDQIPLPPAANEFLDRLIEKHEREEEVPVLHAWYSDHDDVIRITLQTAFVMDGKIVDTEHYSGYRFEKAKLSWVADGTIAPRSRLSGYRAAAVYDRLKKSA